MFKWFRDRFMSKPKTAADVLDIIDEFLCQDNIESGWLEDILAALRGPDEESRCKEKEPTTERIRSKAFPKARKRFGSTARWLMVDGEPEAYFGDGLTHFEEHVNAAIHALKRIRGEE